MANFNFTKIAKEEALKILDELAFNRKQVTLWRKGHPYRHHFNALKVSEGKQSTTLFIDPHDHGLVPKIGHHTLGSFTHEGLSFFISGTFICSKDSFSIDLQGDIFKCERRSNFRIKEEDTLNLYLFLEKNKFNFLQEEDIERYLEMKFHDNPNFALTNEQYADMIEEHQNESNNIIESVENIFHHVGEKENYVGYPVFDISLTGISFFADEITRFTLKKHRILNEIKVILNDHLFVIPDSNIVYAKEIPDPQIKHKVNYRMALNFGQLNAETQKNLSRVLNEIKRPDEDSADFERYINKKETLK